MQAVLNTTNRSTYPALTPGRRICSYVLWMSGRGQLAQLPAMETEMTNNVPTSNGNSGGSIRAPTPEFLNAYATSAREAAEQAVKSLDTSINWALTLTLGILAFVVNSSVERGGFAANKGVLLLAITAAGFPMLLHFGIRAAKNYINTVRFAKLEREALKCNLLLENGSPKTFTTALTHYHLCWKSPIGPCRIILKVLFEFGFSYLFALLMCTFWFISREIQNESYLRLTVVLAIIPMLIEVRIFSHSPYIKDYAPDENARKLS
ncbi:MAG: hypothetical protein ACYC9L_15555 [Sulfuricaulis sp.]